MKNKIVLIKDSDFTFENEVLIFANEKDLIEHFQRPDNNIQIVCDEDKVIVEKYGYKTVYNLHWAKEIS